MLSICYALRRARVGLITLKSYSKYYLKNQSIIFKLHTLRLDHIISSKNHIHINISTIINNLPDFSKYPIIFEYLGYLL